MQAQILSDTGFVRGPLSLFVQAQGDCKACFGLAGRNSIADGLRQRSQDARTLDGERSVISVAQGTNRHDFPELDRERGLQDPIGAIPESIGVAS